MTDPALRLILVRHGNTFAPGEKVVAVGRRQDLPLVPKGLEQAQACADALVRSRAIPNLLVCGPLRRHRQTAHAMLDRWGRASEAPTVDPRLDELDYGGWAGLSDLEIAEKYGETALRGWRDHGRWPQGQGWPEDEPELTARTEAFGRELLALAPGQTVVAVSSGGLLRYFLKQVPGAFETRARIPGGLSVKTGHYCELQLYSSAPAQLRGWNLSPAVDAA